MKHILFPYNITDRDNEYVQRFIEIISKNKEYCVTASLSEFWSSEKYYDFIIISWQESLTDWKGSITQEEINNVINQFKAWQNKNCKIIIIRHNEYPHMIRSKEGKALYDQTYSLADGIIHLGNYSFRKFQEKYPQAFQRQHHCILHHPLYKSFDTSLSQNELRRKLNIAEDELIIFAPGSIRHQWEFNLAIKILRKISSKKKSLIIMRNIAKPPRIRYLHKFIPYKIRQYLIKKTNKIIEYPGLMSENNLSELVALSDIILIPRTNVLNSGNVFLGSQFGKIIIGPNCGNIKEQLEYLDQIIFDEKDFSNFSKKINLEIQKRRENKDFSQSVKNKISIYSDEIEFSQSFNRFIQEFL